MSQNELLQSVINYLETQKNTVGRTKVYRTAIYAVMEDRHGIDGIFSGKALTRNLMEQAAAATGGEYVTDKGRAHVKF